MSQFFIMNNGYDSTYSGPVRKTQVRYDLFMDTLVAVDKRSSGVSSNLPASIRPSGSSRNLQLRVARIDRCRSAVLMPNA